VSTCASEQRGLAHVIALVDNRVLDQSGLFFLDQIIQHYLILLELSISHQTDLISIITQAGHLTIFPSYLVNYVSVFFVFLVSGPKQLLSASLLDMET
jgi:hypothetical protein